MTQTSTRRPAASRPPALLSFADRTTSFLSRHLHSDAAGGVILLLAAAAALLWANSPAQHSYHALWHAMLGFSLGDFQFTQSVHFWVNDVLMTVFFLIVGMEIRREMHSGALAEPRQALLPMLAALGGVAVPALDGAENYIKTLDHGGYFEVTALSKEDLKKTELYHQNAERAKAQAAFADYGQYLDSLEMTATIKGFEPLYIQRIAQLTNKSNQFNLTTLRCSEDDIRAMAGDKNDLCLCGKLVDKFGDNGIVTVVAGRQQGDVLDLTLWLMSCRVLKRGMEDAMMDTVVAEAAARGVKTIVGHYYPTAKNAMVREFYAQYDFAKTAEDADGNTEWTLDVAAYTPKHPHMKIER